MIIEKKNMNKKRFGIIAVLSILNIPFSIYLSAIIHTKLANIEFLEIVVDKQLLLLFFLIYLLIQVVIIMFWGLESNNVFKSGTISITDKLRTPKIMGEGQHGTARWLSEKEFKNAFKCNISYFLMKKPLIILLLHFLFIRIMFRLLNLLMNEVEN